MRARVFDAGSDGAVDARDGVEPTRAGIRVIVPAELSSAEAIRQLRAVLRLVERTHRNTVERAVEAAARAAGVRRCDRCGSTLVERTGRHGPFLGCSAFPRCTFTAPIELAGEARRLELGREVASRIATDPDPDAPKVSTGEDL